MDEEISDFEFSRGHHITQLRRAPLLPESVSCTPKVVQCPALGGCHRGNSQRLMQDKQTESDWTLCSCKLIILVNIVAYGYNTDPGLLCCIYLFLFIL